MLLFKQQTASIDVTALNASYILSYLEMTFYLSDELPIIWNNEDVYELVSEHDRLQKAAKNEYKNTGRAEKGHEMNKQDQNWDFFPWVNVSV